jgi:hypothetical protein
LGKISDFGLRTGAQKSAILETSLRRGGKCDGRQIQAQKAGEKAETAANAAANTQEKVALCRCVSPVFASWVAAFFGGAQRVTSSKSIGTCAGARCAPHPLTLLSPYRSGLGPSRRTVYVTSVIAGSVSHQESEVSMRADANQVNTSNWR